MCRTPLHASTRCITDESTEQRQEDEQQLEAEVEQHRKMLERRDKEAKQSQFLYVYAGLVTTGIEALTS